MQHNCFSATTSFLMLLEGSIRHARSTVRCSSVPAVACIFGQSTSQLICTACWGAVCNALFPHAWQYDCSSSSWCLNAHQFARRLLDDEGWCGHHSSENSATILRCCSTCIDHLRFSLDKSEQVAVCLSTLVGLPSSLRLCMGGMPTHFLLVIDGCSSWTLPRISVVGTVSVKL